MNPELSSFAARLRGTISKPKIVGEPDFNSLALELFALQFQNNSAYRKICEARKLTPPAVGHWTQIPHVPTSLFKELELSSIAPAARAAIFYSSGTTKQKPSRHFHCAESLALYETSLWKWFEKKCGTRVSDCELICLTPPPALAPDSSLVHMFETIRQKFNAPKNVFTGKISADGSWELDFEAMIQGSGASVDRRNSPMEKEAVLCRDAATSKLILGTAFSFVHLIDFLAEKNILLQLPPGSRVMETGGYKNRSRTIPKAELHSLLEKFLGVPRENIICEYGMSELSSQAYAKSSGAFEFSPWARAQIISPETGREVADGETGLIRIFDLANVFSVAAIQTEDLGVRRDDGFELIGRAQLAEPRGCSLMTA
jgi:hypothetical protein